MTDTTTIAATPGPHLADTLDPDATEREWAPLESTPALQVWLLGRPTGASTGPHDHHGAAGAFHVVCGHLHERSYAGGFRARDLTAGEGRASAAGTSTT